MTDTKKPAPRINRTDKATIITIPHGWTVHTRIKDGGTDRDDKATYAEFASDVSAWHDKVLLASFRVHYGRMHGQHLNNVQGVAKVDAFRALNRDLADGEIPLALSSKRAAPAPGMSRLESAVVLQAKEHVKGIGSHRSMAACADAGELPDVFKDRKAGDTPVWDESKCLAYANAELWRAGFNTASIGADADTLRALEDEFIARWPDDRFARFLQMERDD